METVNYMQLSSTQEQYRSHIHSLQNNKSMYLKINLGFLKMLNSIIKYIT